ncbi:MAG: Abi family protein [Lachnospiraceae bacterium]|nr:Abi family protein [Lachnospiraceae bacterium]
MAGGVPCVGSTFFYTTTQREGIHIAKTFSTYEQQLNKLQQDKALIISDANTAKQSLEKLSYYSLINGYKNLFKHTPSQKYIYGVTFDEIVAFYYFDEELRSLFMKYILHVERHIKSLLSYYFCEKYGESDTEYLNTNNYTLTKKNSAQISRLVHSMQKAIALPSRYAYISHHANTYGNVPLWVAMNAFTFGQTSKMFQYITNDVQYKISQKFEHITERELHQFITVLARCRNVCAHGERLFSFRIHETIPDSLLHKKMQIPQKNGNYLYGKQDLFAVVIALRYLISAEDFKVFKSGLTKLINKVLKQCPHLTREQLLKEMGFPENWEKIIRYKK